jgi:hypothetical protein
MSRRQQRRKLIQRRGRTRIGLAGSGALVLTLIPAAAAEARPPTFEVTNANSSGQGSLAAAINNVNLGDTTPAAPAVITFASKLTGAINLTEQLPAIRESVDIRGPGVHKLRINASGISATMTEPLITAYYGGALTVSGLSIVNAVVTSSNSIVAAVGGGRGTEINLSSDSFLNDAGNGNGAVFNSHGNLSVRNCTFSNDRSSSVAGALGVAYGTLTVDDSTFTGNRAEQIGGAVSVLHGSAHIEDSTFTHNVASEAGGALAFTDLDATITASTINGNSVSYAGTHESIAGYGGGVSQYGGKLTLQDTIVAGNNASGNKANVSPLFPAHFRDVFLADGAKLSASFSLIQHDTKGFSGLSKTDILGKAPDLAPLAFNGGPTETERPRKGSPVINAGQAFGLKTDQRGDKRKVAYPKVKWRKGSDGTDIGAVELQTPKKPKKRR